ncbi:hypothetical protein SDC9_176165 [bioreactor metagenome]|uniref:Uncharacterized protein n=1 Tax=bioreactor metagenome TaxID=1076179 RepID=A0A645GR66_9ZZZZ
MAPFPHLSASADSGTDFRDGPFQTARRRILADQRSASDGPPACFRMVRGGRSGRRSDHRHASGHALHHRNSVLRSDEAEHFRTEKALFPLHRPDGEHGDVLQPLYARKGDAEHCRGCRARRIWNRLLAERCVRRTLSPLHSGRLCRHCGGGSFLCRKGSGETGGPFRK